MPTISRDDASDLLFEEASLLDAGRFDDWLALFTDDAVYWVPSDRSATDASSAVSLVYDDRSRLAERVWRLTSGYAHAQVPASLTTHLVTNVRVIDQPSADEAGVESAFVVHELRRETRSAYAGRCRHTLRRAGDGELRIACKRVDLLEATVGLGNVSIIL